MQPHNAITQNGARQVSPGQAVARRAPAQAAVHPHSTVDLAARARSGEDAARLMKARSRRYWRAAYLLAALFVAAAAIQWIASHGLTFSQILYAAGMSMAIIIAILIADRVTNSQEKP
jgi:trans-aconitate methyltransferase